MNNKQIILTEEELEIIGAHRYQQEHAIKGLGKITVACFSAALIFAFLLFKFVPGYMYVFGLLPAFIPTIMYSRVNSKAIKAGQQFAKERLD